MAKANVIQITIEVPENLRVPPDELEERLRIELALRLYEKGITSLSEWNSLELLTREGIPTHYGEEELRGYLQVIRKFMDI
ncbi:UPF0175 family protein [archaeon]|nr:MAG: UPF0175 family protein [archaeon]